MAAIHAASFPANEIWGPDAIALQLGLPGTFGFLQPEGGMVLCRVALDEAELLTLAVAPGKRRRGIGAALLHEAMRRAAGLGAGRIFLEVSPQNEAALKLYTAAGFRRVGLRQRYYADGSDALVLRTDITPFAGADA